MWIASLALRECATTVRTRSTEPGQPQLKAAKTSYFIEIDGCISLEPHPGPRDAAFRAALEHEREATVIRMIVIEGEHPLSEAAKRSIYQFDPRERRWVLLGN